MTIFNQMIEDYPLATEVVRDWFIQKMEDSLRGQELPEDFKEIMRKQGFPNEKLVKLFESTPRVLFDVFDDNGVIINVLHSDAVFVWDVNNVKSIYVYSSRKEAETHAVQRAFQILQEKLNNDA